MRINLKLSFMMKKFINIIGNRGYVLLFVLSFYLVFLNWFYLIILYQYEYVLSHQYIAEINKNLSLEEKAINLFLDHDLCDKTTVIDELRVEYICFGDYVEIIIHKQMPYSFIYDIMDTQNE